MLRAVLEQFFSIEDGCWKHRRVEAELANAGSRRAKAAEKATKAAAARWSKAKVDAPSIPQAMHKECPSPSPSPIEEEPSSLRSDGGAPVVDEPALTAVEARKPSRKSVPAKPRPRAERVCPPGFVVTQDLLDWARSECPGVDIDRETGKMRDHEFKTARSNWPGVWRNWIREAYDRLQTSGPISHGRASNRRMTAAERGDAFSARLYGTDDRRTIDVEVIDATDRQADLIPFSG